MRTSLEGSVGMCDGRRASSAAIAFPTLRVLHACSWERAAHASLWIAPREIILPFVPCLPRHAPLRGFFCGYCTALSCPRQPLLQAANNLVQQRGLVRRCQLESETMQSSIADRSNETLLASLDVRR
jgi:hypothetical protein